MSHIYLNIATKHPYLYIRYIYAKLKSTYLPRTDSNKPSAGEQMGLYQTGTQRYKQDLSEASDTMCTPQYIFLTTSLPKINKVNSELGLSTKVTFKQTQHVIPDQIVLITVQFFIHSRRSGANNICFLGFSVSRSRLWGGLYRRVSAQGSDTSRSRPPFCPDIARDLFEDFLTICFIIRKCMNIALTAVRI